MFKKSLLYLLLYLCIGAQGLLTLTKSQDFLSLISYIPNIFLSIFRCFFSRSKINSCEVPDRCTEQKSSDPKSYGRIFAKDYICLSSVSTFCLISLLQANNSALGSSQPENYYPRLFVFFLFFQCCCSCFFLFYLFFICSDPVPVLVRQIHFSFPQKTCFFFKYKNTRFTLFQTTRILAEYTPLIFSYHNIGPVADIRFFFIFFYN